MPEHTGEGEIKDCDLAAPVTFEGEDAERFLRELPRELPADEVERLRAAVASAQERSQ